MSDGVIGSDAGEYNCASSRKMTESEISDYRQRMISKASGSTIHKLNNMLQAVILTNDFEMFDERDEKMKVISSLLSKTITISRRN